MPPRAGSAWPRSLWRAGRARAFSPRPAAPTSAASCIRSASSTVFDSRSSAFADGVGEATGGRGVDLVLNSLTGDLMRLGLELVAPAAGFLEIARRDFTRREQAAAINPAADYRVIDLVAACRAIRRGCGPCSPR
jgi:hypothetical protein